MKTTNKFRFAITLKESGISEIVKEGDMLVTVYPEDAQSASLIRLERIWPNATIPYIISDEYGNLIVLISQIVTKLFICNAYVYKGNHLFSTYNS